ncbi:MAG: hypothetical protein GXX86_08440, partial [Propionibacterium sp.]|nr:hypothetical protein [Propionibacterium sp.]
MAVMALSACGGSSPLTPQNGSDDPESEATPPAEACPDVDREHLVPPFDTEGDCWQVPNVIAAAGTVGIGFDDPRWPETGHFVDFSTGAAREFEIPENAQEVQALVTPVDGAPLFLVTGYEQREGDAFTTDCYAPFALGFDLNGSSNPAYEALGDCLDPSDDWRVSATHVWAPPAVLDIATNTWAEVEFDDFPREVGPYTRLMSRPDQVGVFGGNLVQAISTSAFRDDTFHAVRGLFAMAPDG